MKIKIEKEEVLGEEHLEEKGSPAKHKKPRAGKTKPKETEESWGVFAYLGYFLAIVGICILIALVARFIFVYKKSTFTSDGYAVLVSSRNPFIASYEASAKKITYLELKNYRDGDRIKESLALGFPLDGYVKTPVDVSSQNFSKYSAMLSFFFRQFQSKFDNTTILDVSKLISSSMSVSKKDVEAKTVIISQDGAEGITSDEIYSAFKDSDVINEGLSIEVINATSAEGLAGRVGQIIKNTGGNVISVNSQEGQKTSRLLSTRSSKTLTRISHLLGIVPAIVKDLNSQADIRIVLGEDFIKHAP